MLAVGSGLAMPRGPRPRAAPVPLDLSRPLEELLGGIELDVVHVHDPFAPSAASVALRHSRSLNVGSFHEPSERILSTQVARPLVELLFGRLDGRTASFAATRDLVERYFAGSYRIVRPGSDLIHRPDHDGSSPPEIVFSAEEDVELVHHQNYSGQGNTSCRPVGGQAVNLHRTPRVYVLSSHRKGAVSKTHGSRCW